MRFALPLLFLLFTVLAGAEVPPKNPRPQPLTRDRLVYAYGHVKNALALARGGERTPEKAFEKAAAGLDDATLRREIGLMADLAAADYVKASNQAMQDNVMTHLRVATARLTTRREPDMKQAREAIRKRQKDNSRDNPAAELHKLVEAIHEALSAR